MAGRHSRTKGAGGERELCALLSGELGSKITRQLGQARDGGHDVSLPPFRIEVKRRARIGNLYEWIAQAQCEFIPSKRDPIGDSVVIHQNPVVACRGDGKEWLVIMYLTDWIKLAREEIANGSSR